MSTLREQLEEIRSSLGNHAAPGILKDIDDAIASDNDDIMKNALHRFDSLSTQIITRMRKTDTAE